MALAAALLTLISPDPKPFSLMVGDLAPKLDVSKWVKGAPVSRFERGQVYVLETWATWCVPCLKTAPHLSSIQKKYGSKVNVIGVSIWEENSADVVPFIAKRGSEMEYRIAMDQVPPNGDRFQGKTSKNWVVAAGRYSVGVPLAFVVDQGGRLAWIGHPLDLDQPLKQIVEGRWDLKAEAAKYRKEMEPNFKSEPLIMAYYQAQVRKDPKTEGDSARKLFELDPKRFSNYVGKGMAAYLPNKLVAEAFSFGASISKTDCDYDALLEASRYLLSKSADSAERQAVVLSLAKAAERKSEGKKAVPFAIQARIAFFRGEKKSAYDLQSKAVSLATPEERGQMESRLAEYKAPVS
jgi:thiol-disulfide isomerase/thioredoxin